MERWHDSLEDAQRVDDILAVSLLDLFVHLANRIYGECERPHNR